MFKFLLTGFFLLSACASGVPVEAPVSPRKPQIITQVYQGYNRAIYDPGLPSIMVSATGGSPAPTGAPTSDLCSLPVGAPTYCQKRTGGLQ